MIYIKNNHGSKIIIIKTTHQHWIEKQYHNKNNNLIWAMRLLIRLYKNVIHNEYIKQY